MFEKREYLSNIVTKKGEHVDPSWFLDRWNNNLQDFEEAQELTLDKVQEYWIPKKGWDSLIPVVQKSFEDFVEGRINIVEWLKIQEKYA